MRNISYKRVITNPSAAADEISHRARKQSKVYTISFIVLGAVVLFYILYNLSITQYDGFMVSRNVNIRHSGNIAVLDYWVKPGDYIKEGDTLYSYVNVDWMNSANTPYANINIKSNIVEARARYNRLMSEYVKQKKTYDSLKYVTQRVAQDVRYGVATKEYAEEKDWELFLVKMDVENTARLIEVEQNVIQECQNLERIATRGLYNIASYSQSQRMTDLDKYGEAFAYRVAYVDMEIVNIQARHGVLIMAGEPTLTYMPYNNPEMLDMHVKMLLTPEQFSEIDQGEIYNAYAGEDFIGKVRTTYSSTFVNDAVNVEEQNKYEYKFNNREILVRAEFLDPETVYHKYKVDKHPIVLMKYKWDFMNEFIDGLHEDQRRAYEIKIENKQRISEKSKK